MVQSQLPAGSQQYAQYTNASNTLVDPGCLTTDYQAAIGGYLPMQAGNQNSAMVMALQQQVALQQQQAALAHSMQQAQVHSLAKPLELNSATAAAVASPVDTAIQQQIASPASQMTPPHSSPSDTATPVNLVPTTELTHTSEQNLQVSISFIRMCTIITFLYLYNIQCFH